ncbi:MAG TPA: alpha-amylase family glycosyl hydrolase [Microbacteriaceae bacterium]|jgi:alpha-glucosidase|nr:alpha-amylase family glycosyl hydrolase [Microbacteriaceae bacterium]
MSVIYQIYVRSFQDSDGDGVGDIPGVTRRLDYLASLGIDALWLSPIYASPLADGGYDVSDHMAVHPDLGTLEDVRDLLSSAHQRGLEVLFDLVPSHTSITHPWFQEHPEWYVWSAKGPPNNWLGAFGGRAWSRAESTGDWYLHSFYPEEPDLDWRNPRVHEAFAEVIHFWTELGVDGFRVDAVDCLAKDPLLRDDPPATVAYPLPLPGKYGELRHVHSRNAPGYEEPLAAIREAAGGRMLLGEVYRPTAELAPYLEFFDGVFAFEFLFAEWSARNLARVVREAAAIGRVVWVLANHDAPRLATRVGSEHARLAAMLLLTLPGAACIYQGEELGLLDGDKGATQDRAGRDASRHPMQWDPSANGGFTDGVPWLPLVDPQARNATDQLADPDSLLTLYRSLLRVRKTLGGAFVLDEVSDDVLSYQRGVHRIVLNFADSARHIETDKRVVLSTDPAWDERNGWLAPRSGVILFESG